MHSNTDHEIAEYTVLYWHSSFIISMPPFRSDLMFHTAGSKTIDQNRPIHTYALSFSPGMQPNNGAHYTLFAMLT